MIHRQPQPPPQPLLHPIMKYLLIKIETLAISLHHMSQASLGAKVEKAFWRQEKAG